MYYTQAEMEKLKTTKPKDIYAGYTTPAWNRVLKRLREIRPDTTIRSGSGYRPTDNNSDHSKGYAVDIVSTKLKDMWDAFLDITSNRKEFFETYGITRCYLSTHNRHLHISFNPWREMLYGWETKIDDPSVSDGDPAKYPIVGFWSFPESYRQSEKAAKLYCISAVDAVIKIAESPLSDEDRKDVREIVDKVKDTYDDGKTAFGLTIIFIMALILIGMMVNKQ